jgi:acetyl-CoA carboxylase biotin carboxyl carrier protein
VSGDDDARGASRPDDEADRPVEVPDSASLDPATSTDGRDALVIEVDGVPEADAPTPRDGGDVELLALIDRLAALLDRSDLSELGVEAGGTGLVLRKPVQVAPVAATPDPALVPASMVATAVAGEPSAAGRDPATSARPSVKAPLTGIFYASPAPGSAPYVQVGGEVAVGQIVGLIEAMKLFNEIKSDLAGRVVKLIPESGTLVKAKQPLVEVDPL